MRQGSGKGKRCEWKRNGQGVGGELTSMVRRGSGGEGKRNGRKKIERGRETEKDKEHLTE